MSTLRSRLARHERSLLGAGLALVTLHLLGRALDGPDTSLLAVALIIAAPVAAWLAQPRVTRATRFAGATVAGLIAAGAGGVSHTLRFFTGGAGTEDISGVLFTLGGLALIAAGLAALAAPSGPRPSVRRVIAWVAGAVAALVIVVFPVGVAIIANHGFRNGVDDDALGIAHETVRFPMADGDEIAAWWVPSRNGAAVIVAHGSGGNRSRVADEARMLAANGYGVLSIDLPGAGDSDGRASLLGAGAQPAIDAALDHLAKTPGVDPGRIAGFGSSLGAEVLLEAASRDDRLAAVVSEGAERISDDRRLGILKGTEKAGSWLQAQAASLLAGEEDPAPLADMIGRVAPRPVLLIAAGGPPDEIRVNRIYREKAGPTAQLWAIPESGHTQGIYARPAEYERRVTSFLDEALG
jgi:dienelactone hydrolase